MLEVESEVTGKVWQLHVQAGDQVTAGQTLLVLESMKMEIPVLAPTAGEVIELLVGQDDSVEEDQVLLRIAPS